MPTLAFWMQLAIQCIKNTIGTEPDDISMPMRAYKMSQISERHLEKVLKYRGKWLPSEKSKHPSRNIRISATRTIKNAGIDHGVIVDWCF